MHYSAAPSCIRDWIDCLHRNQATDLVIAVASSFVCGLRIRSEATLA